MSQNESGNRAKFVKKSEDHKDSFILNEELREKAEKLIGVKGYCTNIPENVLSNDQVIEYYHGLWHVEQAFRMSKTDLKTRPIFHYEHEAIRAHVLVCFMGLYKGEVLRDQNGIIFTKGARSSMERSRSSYSRYANGKTHYIADQYFRF